MRLILASLKCVAADEIALPKGEPGSIEKLLSSSFVIN